MNDIDGPIEFNFAVAFLQSIHECRLDISKAIRQKDPTLYYDKLVEIMTCARQGFIQRGADEEKELKPIEEALKNMEKKLMGFRSLGDPRIEQAQREYMITKKRYDLTRELTTLYGTVMDILWRYGFVFPGRQEKNWEDEFDKDFHG